MEDHMAEDKKARRVEILGRKRLLDAFFKVDEVTVSHETFKGGVSKPRSYLVLERGDAVAALLYDPDRGKVITVNQFRAPAVDLSKDGGWLIEAVAGMINGSVDNAPEETPFACLVREVEEETGYKVSEAHPICNFFASPGGSSERIYLFYAEVRETDKVAQGGGLTSDGEDIQIVEFDREEFFAKLMAGEFEDPKLIIAGLWFMVKHAQRG
jgi:nudix-type nucleoside diphosphatase (YffH/AdpP family)